MSPYFFGTPRAALYFSLGPLFVLLYALNYYITSQHLTLLLPPLSSERERKRDHKKKEEITSFRLTEKVKRGYKDDEVEVKEVLWQKQF